MGEVVRDSIDRCERLIESLLMLARSEAGAGQGQPVDVAALAADCITDLGARAREAGVRLNGNMQPAWVSGAPALLERMIANLLDNGIRYNDRGGELDISIHSQAGRVVLRVANGGARIEPEEVESLMQPFRRLGRGDGGFGLGLSIVRSVVSAHAGTVHLEAPEAGGLVVRVALPAAPAPTNVMVGEESRALTPS